MTRKLLQKKIFSYILVVTKQNIVNQKQISQIISFSQEKVFSTYTVAMSVVFDLTTCYHLTLKY